MTGVAAKVAWFRMGALHSSGSGADSWCVESASETKLQAGELFMAKKQTLDL